MRAGIERTSLMAFWMCVSDFRRFLLPVVLGIGGC